MGSLIYFLPLDKTCADREDFVRAGIAYAVEDQGLCSRRITDGPGGQLGVLVTVCGSDGSAPPPVYDPTTQQWVCDPAGRFAIGFDNRHRPSPEDLRRKRFVGGEDVCLRDGATWTIPVCFSIVRGTSLPKALTIGPDLKTWSLRELPEFLKLCADAERVWEAYKGSEGGAVTMDAQDAPRIASDALAVNYRVSAVELSLLGLLSTNEMWDVLKAVIDGYTVERVAVEMQKKSAQPVRDVPALA